LEIVGPVPGRIIDQRVAFQRMAMECPAGRMRIITEPQAASMVDDTLIGMEQLPRLVSGNCPNCSSTEIIVKTIYPDRTNYEGYCPGCGIDIVGALINGMTRAVVLK
jgi:hypothetical protein